VCQDRHLTNMRLDRFALITRRSAIAPFDWPLRHQAEHARPVGPAVRDHVAGETASDNGRVDHPFTLDYASKGVDDHCGHPLLQQAADLLGCFSYQAHGVVGLEKLESTRTPIPRCAVLIRVRSFRLVRCDRFLRRQSRDLRATELGHQDPLGYPGAVSSEHCLRQVVTRVDIVDREAGSPSEHDGNIGMAGESARSAGPLLECDWRIGLALTLRGTTRNDRQVRTLLGSGSWPQHWSWLRSSTLWTSEKCTDVMGAPWTEVTPGCLPRDPLISAVRIAAQMSQSGC
jgi:hypothetical protein